MFENLKKKYIDWHIGHYLKKTKRSKQFLNWNKINSVVFLVDATTIKVDIMDYVREKCDGKKVMFWSMVHRKEDKKETVFLNQLSYSDDTDMFGKPNGTTVRRFADFKADVLIDLTQAEILPLKYLAATSDAKCKCAIARPDDIVFDFTVVIKPGMSEKGIFDNILHYLETINA